MKHPFLPERLTQLLKYNFSASALIFLLLEIWRPCFYLTSDNLLSLYAIFTEMGRNLKNGQSPFISHYIYGGNYDLSRDVGFIYWHPFYLIPSLLSDTIFRFWMFDVIAFLFLFVATLGFTLLAYVVREEYNRDLPDKYIVLYTCSYLFGTYMLMAGSSFINYLGNQGALPWLALGILDKKLTRGLIIIALVSVHQFLSSYAGLTLTSTLFLSVFALGIAVSRRSTRPVLIWGAGNLIALALIAPFLLHVIGGFSKSERSAGLAKTDPPELSIPASVVPFSFLLGNWSDIRGKLQDSGETGSPTPTATVSIPAPLSDQPPIAIEVTETRSIPLMLMACAAAWCLFPALLNSSPWRGFDLLCVGMILLILIMIIRPPGISETMKEIPFLKSLRWPYREIMQLQFFIHLFLVARPWGNLTRLQPKLVFISFLAFLLPLPWATVPSFGVCENERQAIFSGAGEVFWKQVKKNLRPNDQIVTIIDKQLIADVLYDKRAYYIFLGTANFPDLYQVVSASGYSTTAPLTSIPLKTTPAFQFGSFSQNQVTAILSERPNLRLIRLESVEPLKITLSDGTNPPIDLTPLLK